MAKKVLFAVILIVVVLFGSGCFNVQIKEDVDFPAGLFAAAREKLAVMERHNPDRVGGIANMHVLVYDGQSRELVQAALPMWAVRMAGQDEKRGSASPPGIWPAVMSIWTGPLWGIFRVWDRDCWFRWKTVGKIPTCWSGWNERASMLSLPGAVEGLMSKPMAMVTEASEHDREFEHQLAARIQGGDQEAFAELVRLFQKNVFSLAYGFFRDRDDALEIVQETFMKVYEKIGSYRPDHSLQSWIYRVAYNLCVDFYRKYAKKRKLEDGFDNVPARQLASADDCQAAWESRQLDEAIEQAVKNLSRKQKEVFSLKYRQGLKLRQVAEVMAISLGTVKALHHRALKRIRREVAPSPGGEYESMS